MNNEIIVRVYDIVGGPLCVSADDGQKVYDKIAPLLRDGQKVALSFFQVKTMISAFLNAAVGQLYSEFTEDQIRERILVKDIDPEDLELLKRVVDNAKVYFRNREKFDEAWKEEVGDEE
ncbi:MAG: STAS-like domain-containing protein [Nitrospirae bacterium]|nr:STAS-like domain-containing protein [Nitrospirota bacterium]